MMDNDLSARTATSQLYRRRTAVPLSMIAPVAFAAPPTAAGHAPSPAPCAPRHAVQFAAFGVGKFPKEGGD